MEDDRLIKMLCSHGDWLRPMPTKKKKPSALELYYTNHKQLKLF